MDPLGAYTPPLSSPVSGNGWAHRWRQHSRSSTCMIRLRPTTTTPRDTRERYVRVGGTRRLSSLAPGSLNEGPSYIRTPGSLAPGSLIEGPGHVRRLSSLAPGSLTEGPGGEGMGRSLLARSPWARALGTWLAGSGPGVGPSPATRAYITHAYARTHTAYTYAHTHAHTD